MIVYSVGFGVRAPMLTVAANYVSSASTTGKLYTLMSMTDALTHIPGDPFIQWVWASALGIGDVWLILPFVVLAVGLVYWDITDASKNSQGLFLINTTLFFVLSASHTDLQRSEEQGTFREDETRPLLSADRSD